MFGGGPVRSYPPQLLPVAGAMVEQDRHPRVGGDVVQPSEPPPGLRLAVDCKDDGVVDHRVHDRDEMGSAVGADRGEDRELGGCGQSAPAVGQSDRSSRRRILPDADLGMASRNSTALIRLYEATWLPT
jgi:hypothetical protein